MAELLAVAIVLRSKDDKAPANEWELVPPEDVPDFVKDPEVMGRLLVDGEVAKLPDGDYWYRAVKRTEISNEEVANAKPAHTH